MLIADSPWLSRLPGLTMRNNYEGCRSAPRRRGDKLPVGMRLKGFGEASSVDGAAQHVIQHLDRNREVRSPRF